MAGRARRLATVLPHYARIAYWGLLGLRLRGREALVVYQAVVRSERGVLLSVRRDLHGWELPGGNAQPGERGEEALRREVREETGVEVVVERWVGDYRRTGFAPHTARVYACRPVGGTLRPSAETPVVRWFDPGAPPSTLFPWYRVPLADALAEHPEPVLRHEHQGPRAVLAGMWIDLRMRTTDHRAGLPRSDDPP
ncbi:MAG: NUDIX domain-containing protein [Myxococcales bacterium]|nr:NUDIX domain-containing protein [Myxococcales bacterium]